MIDKKRLANELDAPFCLICQCALEGEAVAPSD